MRFYIVVFNKPWKTVVVSVSHDEAVQAYEHGPKSERRLMLAWDIINGIEIFQADLSYLKWTAMQPRPIGLSILNSEDSYGLNALLENELVKIIRRDRLHDPKIITLPLQEAA